jgi:hypothetical protein
MSLSKGFDELVAKDLLAGAIKRCFARVSVTWRWSWQQRAAQAESATEKHPGGSVGISQAAHYRMKLLYDFFCTSIKTICNSSLGFWDSYECMKADGDSKRCTLKKGIYHPGIDYVEEPENLK